ncbi:MAG: hypothetical protein IIW17_06300 [Clostridia bacterium]|nr:hypothetical protein [Clostridia bacterium]
MKKDLFTDGVSHIDVDAVERLLQIEQKMQEKKKRQRYARLLLIPAAALIALMVCMTAVIIPFIPKTLDVAYEPIKGKPENVWVYYVNDKGTQKRERVNLPGGTQNVFAAWKHLNVVGDEVEILNYSVETDTTQPTVEPNTLWEFVQQQLALSAQKSVTVTLSPQITSYENYDALIDSLIETIAKYAGVAPEQVRILIDGKQIGAVIGGLQFYHSLHNTPMIVGVGSRLEITVGMTNVSDQNIEFTGSWSAFAPSAILTMDNTAVIAHEDFPMTEEYQKYVLAPGESREITYIFPIPENATTGLYDLFVSYGQKSIKFAGAVHVVFSTPADSATDFQEFLVKYGFYTTDPTLFRSAVEKLSFSGMNLFDIMTRAQIDYAEGYSGEEYGSQWFSYGYMTLPNGNSNNYFGNSNNYFVAKKIPDDMRLPCGITFADTLYNSLCKMGLTDHEAEEIIACLETGNEQRIYLGNRDLCVTRDESGNYVIRYTPLSFMSSPHPVCTLDIIYSRAEMIAQVFLVKAGVSDFSTDAFTAPITVAPLAYASPDRELNESDAQILIDIFMGCIGTWKTGELDAEYDYRIISKGMVYRYSTRTGVLADSGGYMALSNAHRQIVNEIVTKGNYQPNFQNIAFIEVPDGSSRDYNLPTLVAQRSLYALNNAEWQDGSIDSVGILLFDCDGTMVEYTSGTFFTAGHYCRVDSYTEDCTDALEAAVIGMRSGEYDAILYYAGTYYGHSAAVDEKLNGTMGFSMNIAPRQLENILFAYNDKQAVDALGDIVDCKNAVDKGVLLTNNSAYFERITEIKPDLSKGEVRLIEVGMGLPPTCELTPDDAQALRKIFQRAEFTYCFGDNDAIYETTLEINGYTIAYRSSSRNAIIGDLIATLSEADAQTISYILGGYINVE